MKKVCNKHPKDMTTEEAIACVFHPKVLEHLRKHVEKLAEKKPKVKSK
jgi:hypothetical protein